MAEDDVNLDSSSESLEALTPLISLDAALPV